MKQLVIALLALVVCLAATCARSADIADGDRPVGDWPQFRGPGGQGDVGNVALPLQWSESEGVKWKTALPGRGWSSPVIAEGRIWITAAVEIPATASDWE